MKPSVDVIGFRNALEPNVSDVEKSAFVRILSGDSDKLTLEIGAVLRCSLELEGRAFGRQRLHREASSPVDELNIFELAIDELIVVEGERLVLKHLVFVPHVSAPSVVGGTSTVAEAGGASSAPGGGR